MHKRTFFFNSTQTELNAKSPGASHFSTRYPNDFQIFFKFPIIHSNKISSSSPLYIDYFSGIHLDRRFLRRKERAGPSQGSH